MTLAHLDKDQQENPMQELSLKAKTCADNAVVYMRVQGSVGCTYTEDDTVAVATREKVDIYEAGELIATMPVEPGKLPYDVE